MGRITANLITISFPKLLIFALYQRWNKDRMAFDSGNNPLTSPHERYDFSFPSATLRWRELAQADTYDQKRPYADTALIQTLGAGPTETGKRILREMRKRLASLNEDQLQLLINGNAIVQKQMAYLAICKTHHFIRDFAVEVIRDKFLSFESRISQSY